MRNLQILRLECLHELFESQADAYPEKVAIICAGQQTTYAELENKSNQLARFLRSKGVARGSLVAMLLNRSENVYICLLAILKTGAAYVPLAPEYPSDRVRYILAECGVHTLVTTSSVASKHSSLGCDVVFLDRSTSELEKKSPKRLLRIETEVTEKDLCYVIYTSGSTGRPKGVAIEHTSACNFVRASHTVYGIKPEDRVYQGFSIAFDASVEEVWMAFFAGATLVVGTSEMMHAGADLSPLLSDTKVSVLSCVPTLLSMMDEDVPTVRLLILGGEQCPQELVTRWSKPGRRILNTYGPTEATVVATYAECTPGKPVTIGRSLPNYWVYILECDLQQVPIGVTGEIHIGGICLARGYINQPELTREKFIANPFIDGADAPSRLYKTGDLGRFTAEGNIEFMGRIDDQVKLRGFRVELSEIESILIECPGVRGAVVSVQEPVPGIQHLVGYIVPKDATALDFVEINITLRSRLPSYMVPAILETIDSLPTLTSGKVDRTRLPQPRTDQFHLKLGYVAPRTELEHKIAEIWETLFQHQAISVNDDFFLDLGGHSLFAARMVSQLRKHPRMKELGMLDVYSSPTIEALAKKLETNCRRKEEAAYSEVNPYSQSKKTTSLALPNWRYPFCGLLQLFGIYFIYGIASLSFIFPYLTAHWIESGGASVPATLIAVTIISLLGLYPLMLGITILVKWVVIGRFKAGSYPLWGWYYFRWWLVRRIQLIVPTEYLAGTPFMSLYCRLMGAKLGSNCYIGTSAFQIYDLLTIGDDTSINADVQLLGYIVEDGMLRIGPIDIGSRCFVGANTVISANTKMLDDTKLGDQSMLTEGAVVRAKASWGGSPARTVSMNIPEVDWLGSEKVKAASWPETMFFGILHWVALVLLPVVPLSAALPTTALTVRLYEQFGLVWCILSAPACAVSFILLLCLEIVLIKWLLLGKVKAGRYKLNSWFYVRKWFVDQLMLLSLDLLKPLYATLYLPPWLRLLGADIGKKAEISTLLYISPDLLSIGDESFVADDVCIGAPRIFMGWMTISATRVGKRAFIGNSALLPSNLVVGDDCLIGSLSVPPDKSTVAEAGTSWVGSPAIFLPRRQVNSSFSEQRTYTPPLGLYRKRLFIEYFRVTLPQTFTVVMLTLLDACLFRLDDYVSLWQLVLIFPVLYFLTGLGTALIVVLFKWLLVGKYEPSIKPLWSTFVWRSEFVTAMYESLAVPLLLNNLLGTPFMAWFIRLLGVKIGARVFMDTTFMTEFDLVRIGSNAALNNECILQTHLFEDRIMKMSRLYIGKKCVVGHRSVILYDTQMQTGSNLNSLSLLMKGETLPGWSYWEGIPARSPSKR